ncbi:MAG: four-carbon acid sugar kinase family protein [Terracidiphilus sp.]
MTGPISTLRDGLLISWYGDDFTGAAAVMEVLALAGLPSVLFFDAPTPALLAKFSGYRGVGIAGVARSKDPEWMQTHLPEIFAALADLNAPLTHYKVCSTLDSAPHLGSIGKAVELAEPYFASPWIPLLIAAPAIHRYQLFGNLFAKVDGVGYRLDRHPTMSRHPVTPMSEADVRMHLAHQTSIPIGLLDALSLNDSAETHLQFERKAGRRLIAIDVVDEMSLIAAGRLIWECRGKGIFAVGSQGVEYAVTAYWRSQGLIETPVRVPQGAPVTQLAVVSGSCSPETAHQIEWAETHGFDSIRLDVRCALSDREWSAELDRATLAGLRAIQSGRDPLVYCARGPEDPAISAFHEAVQAVGADPGAIHEAIGSGLGRILDSILRASGIRRGVFAGGDTSTYGAKALGIHALTFLAPTVPGAPLFRAHADDPVYRDLEIALKGGQMGSPDYFGQMKNGGNAAYGRS